ncbi:MAG: hypothetical protein ACXV8O_05910 [Methylobacter sp.]
MSLHHGQECIRRGLTRFISDKLITVSNLSVIVAALAIADKSGRLS